MLGDPYYVGFVVYKGDIYPGRHEPIITPELFERVQEVMKARSGRGQRDRVHHHYLKGFLFCDRCHQKDRTSRLIFAEVTGRGGIKYQYFVCRGREDGLCDLPHLRVELVEQAIIDHYQILALPNDFVSELRALLDETLADESASVKERHASLGRQLKKLDQQEDRLVLALADDTMPTGKIKAKLQEITIQRARIQAGLTNTTAELGLGVEMLRDALRLVANPRQLYHEGTDSIRRLLNETFFERFYLDDPTWPPMRKHRCSPSCTMLTGPTGNVKPLVPTVCGSHPIELDTALEAGRRVQGGGSVHPAQTVKTAPWTIRRYRKMTTALPLPVSFQSLVQVRPRWSG